MTVDIWDIIVPVVVGLAWLAFLQWQVRVLTRAVKALLDRAVKQENGDA